nr:MAG: replication-associated protein [Canine stool-associated circular virus]
MRYEIESFKSEIVDKSCCVAIWPIISQGILATIKMNKVISLSRILLTWPQTDGTKEELLEFLKSTRCYACSIICKEQHHETEGTHFHAVVKLSPQVKCRHKAAMEMFTWKDHKADIEFLKTKKDTENAIRYVMKDGDYLNDGINIEAHLSGKHEKKWTCQKVLETDMKELVKENVVHPNNFRNILQAQQMWKLMKKPEDCADTRGIWLNGPAGCGKSTWARKFGESKGGFYEKAQNKWWDGYDGEKVVILDDLDTHALNHYLKIWADKFACKGEVKGSTIWLHHDFFVVTSNYSIPDIVRMGQSRDQDYDMELEKALMRRFKRMELHEGQEFFEFVEEEVDEPSQKKTPMNDPLSAWSGSGYE